MHVVATAGHVDHGKSTLVHALTGMEPDRWAEEKRRGMTIDLGFAWTTLPSGAEVAFVDVPGHERFLPNMLAGVGPAPALMFVVAADEGWQAQSDEHLRIADAFGVRHAVVAVTKTDRATADVVAADIRRRFAGTSLSGAATVSVSASSGEGLDELRDALDVMVRSLPSPAIDTPVRMWIDRSFTIRGAGTVVTGTLPAGSLRDGLELELAPTGRKVVVRGLESLKRQADKVVGVARVAVNLRGVDRDEVHRGMALVTPDAWQQTDVVDVVMRAGAQVPADVVVHIGAAAVPARVRRLGLAANAGAGESTGRRAVGDAVRLQLAAALPLHLGDRLILRDPARRVVAGADVADVRPRPLRRRGDAAAVASRLSVPGSADELVARSGAVRVGDVVRAGFADPPSAAVGVDGWWVARARWDEWRSATRSAVAAAGVVDVDTLRRALAAPTSGVVRALLEELDDLVVDGGRVRRVGDDATDPPEIVALVQRLAADPFSAPEADQVALLDRAALGEAARRGRLLHLTGAVYVGPTAPDLAVQRLSELAQPFSVSAARQALEVSRRVAVPLLEHLDARRRTRRLPDGTRIVVTPG